MGPSIASGPRTLYWPLGEEKGVRTLECVYVYGCTMYVYHVCACLHLCGVCVVGREGKGKVLGNKAALPSRMTLYPRPTFSYVHYLLVYAFRYLVYLFCAFN